MCCLRYESETYEELRRKLPRNGSRVKTPAGEGEVVDGQILTQLVLVNIPGKGRSPFGVEDVQVLAPPQPSGKSGAGRAGGRRQRDEGLERAGDERPEPEAESNEGGDAPDDEAAEADDRGPESERPSPPAADPPAPGQAGDPPPGGPTGSRADDPRPAGGRGPEPRDRGEGRRGPPSRGPRQSPLPAPGDADQPPARERSARDNARPADDAPPVDDDRGGFDV
jgi:hypothetical protein